MSNTQLITPDFSEALETGGEIPPGKYNVRVESAEPKKTKAGDTMIKWKLVIFGADGEAAKYNNWPVFYNTMTSGRGAGMLKAFLTAAGYEIQPGTGFSPTDLLGREVTVTLAQGKDQNGEPSQWPEVKRVSPIVNA